MSLYLECRFFAIMFIYSFFLKVNSLNKLQWFLLKMLVKIIPLLYFFQEISSIFGLIFSVRILECFKISIAELFSRCDLFVVFLLYFLGRGIFLCSTGCP